MLMLAGTGASGVSSRGSEGNEGQQGRSTGSHIPQGLENSLLVPPEGRLGARAWRVLPWAAAGEGKWED